MSSLSTVESRLPPGFRFHPRDEELICDYLMKWVAAGSCSSTQQITPPPPPLLIQVDLNKCEPWDIPETACVGGKEWYFYSQRDKKYATGVRTNRATISGYWKATGKDRPIFRKETLVGMRKTLVFYQGRAPKGTKTNWVMHEFRLHDYKAHHVKEDWVLCKVFYKHASPELVAGSGYEVTTPSLTTEPCGITFHDGTSESGDMIVSPNMHHYNQQVPCFSSFSTPNPNSIKMESGRDDNNINNPVMMMMINGPDQSFGEGSSDSTVMSDIHHEVGLSYSNNYLWNH